MTMQMMAQINKMRAGSGIGAAGAAPRYETCRECGKSWNVGRDKAIPYRGYICPGCAPKISRIPRTA